MWRSAPWRRTSSRATPTTSSTSSSATARPLVTTRVSVSSERRAGRGGDSQDASDQLGRSRSSLSPPRLRTSFLADTNGLPGHLRPRPPDRPDGACQPRQQRCRGNGASLHRRRSAPMSRSSPSIRWHPISSPASTNAVQDIFVHDRSTGGTQRVSVGNGGEADQESFWPAINSDGNAGRLRLERHKPASEAMRTSATTSSFVIEPTVLRFVRASAAVGSEAIGPMEAGCPPSVPTARYVGFLRISDEPGRGRYKQRFRRLRPRPAKRRHGARQRRQQRASRGTARAMRPLSAPTVRYVAFLVDRRRTSSPTTRITAATSSSVIVESRDHDACQRASDGQQGESPELLAVCELRRPLHRL